MKKFLMLGIVAALVATTLAGCTQPPTTTSSNDGGSSTPTTSAATVANPFPIPGSTTRIAGSGASFPKPLLETWGYEFAEDHRTVQVAYAGGGSGKGISDITAKTVVFGASDAPLSKAEKDKIPTILQIPETLGLIGVVYNADAIANGLKLDGETVGKIYVGDIARWNDAAIAALNPGVSLPDQPISIVYRSDSSGTTYVFTDWLVHTSPAWKAKMGDAPNKAPTWTKSGNTKQDSGPQNDGVAFKVKNIPYSIGYVELAYVQSMGLKAAMIKSHDGEYLTPTVDGASKAAAGVAATLPASDGDWSKVSIVDAPGAGAYPISSFSYILVYKNLGDYGTAGVSAAQLNGFRAWLWWGIHEGQSFSNDLGYAPLPSGVVAIGEAALHGMTV